MTRYNVRIQAEIETDAGQPFADTQIRYHDMSYESLVELEQVWGQFHDALVGLGPAKIEQHKDNAAQQRGPKK